MAGRSHTQSHTQPQTRPSKPQTLGLIRAVSGSSGPRWISLSPLQSQE